MRSVRWRISRGGRLECGMKTREGGKNYEVSLARGVLFCVGQCRVVPRGGGVMIKLSKKTSSIYLLCILITLHGGLKLRLYTMRIRRNLHKMRTSTSRTCIHSVYQT